MYLLPLDLTPTNHHMESSSWPESLPSNRIKAIEELTKGQILTNKLREMLNQPERIESGAMSVDGVVAEISVMFETTISILTSFEVNEIHPNFGDTTKSPSSWDDRKSEDSGESVKTVISLKPKRGCYKRRKNASSTVIKETSTLIDDGYAWRKYGQKVIQNSIHQRNYYRCTHKFEQGCLATKQVQKTDHQPPMYRITYSGYHTCKNLSRTPQIILDSPNPSENSVLLNFETNTTLVDNKQVGSFSSSMKERLPSLGMKHEQVSPSEDYVPWDVVDTRLSQVSSAPMSMMSSGLDHEDMVSSGLFSSTCSTHGYEMDDILRSNDFDDFPFEFC